MALSLNSPLLFAHSWYQASLRGHWWGSFLFLWILIGAVSLLGMVRSLHRSRTIVMQEGSSRGEWIMLCLLSFITMSGVMYCVTCHKSLLDPGQRAALVMFIGTWIKLSYVLFRALRPAKRLWIRRLSPEVIMLGSIGLTSVTLTLTKYVGDVLIDETSENRLGIRD